MDRDYMHFYRKICASNLPANAVNVYKALLQYANRTTWCCFPSVRTIAKDTKLSERTVRRQLNVLVAHGYILRIPRQRENNGFYEQYVFFKLNRISGTSLKTYCHMGAVIVSYL